MTETTPGRENAPGPAVGEAERAPSKPVPAPASHPLLAPFPLAVMTLAAFLVVFALMMARRTASTGPRLAGGHEAALVAGPGGALRTRASGARTGLLAGAGTGTRPAPASPAVVSRASGSTRTLGDD
jgi:hypothetical protein